MITGGAGSRTAIEDENVDFDYKAYEDPDDDDYTYGDLAYDYEARLTKVEDEYSYGDFDYSYNEAEPEVNLASEKPSPDYFRANPPPKDEEEHRATTVLEDTSPPNEGSQPGLFEIGVSTFNDLWKTITGTGKKLHDTIVEPLIKTAKPTPHPTRATRELGGVRHLDDNWPNNGRKKRSTPEEFKHCSKCAIESMDTNPTRPNLDLFDQYLPMFLKDNPDVQCPKAGHAAYGQVRIQLFIQFSN